MPYNHIFLCFVIYFLFRCFEISSDKAWNKKIQDDKNQPERIGNARHLHSESAMDTRFWASDRTLGSMSSPFSCSPFQMGKRAVNERNMPLWRSSKAAVFFLLHLLCSWSDQAMGSECWNDADLADDDSIMRLLIEAVLTVGDGVYLARRLEVLRRLWSCGCSRANRGN